MDTTKNLLTNLCHLLVCACEVFRYSLTFLWAILCPKAVLAAKLLAVQSQLAVCKHQIGAKKHARPRFTASFRLLWVVLSQRHLERPLREFIEEYYHIARPHRGLDGDTPVSQTKQAQISGPSTLISIPVLGGLHHKYVRVAA